MKAVFKTSASKGGFITATVAPSDRSHEPRFGVLDGFFLVALVSSLAAVVRLVLAN